MPAADVQDIKKGILATYSRNARIAGFRPGKVPASVVARHFAKEVADSLNSELCSRVQNALIDEHKDMKVLDYGTMSVSEEEDGSCVVTSTLTIVPPFELPEYVGIEVTVPPSEVTDDEVELTMKRYAEASAKYVTVERPAANGDLLKIDFKTSVEGKSTAEYCGRPVGFLEGRKDYPFALGEDTFIPGLGEGLVGISAGETRQVLCTLKEDFIFSELAGKEVLFECTVNEVQEKQVPEVSLDIFAGVVPGNSLEEVREEVRKHLQEAKDQQIEELKADQISEKLAEQLSFALPEDLVERENENTVQRKVYAAIQAGNYSISKDMDALRSEAMEETENNLRVYFALLEIAERENISASEQEVMGAIMRMAQQAGEKNIKSYIRKLQSENRITGIRLSIVTSKVIDLMVRQAKVTVKEEAPADEA